MSEVNAWQPIETAPKDGAAVLCFQEHAGLRLIFVGYCCDGEWSQINYYEDGEEPVYQPTHWMPLPADPVKQEGA